MNVILLTVSGTTCQVAATFNLFHQLKLLMTVNKLKKKFQGQVTLKTNQKLSLDWFK